MIIAVCQMKVIPANPVENGIRIKQFVDDALHRTNRQVNMVVFPELAIPGYLIGDLWEEQAFLRECLHVENTIRTYAQQKGVTIVFGNVATTSKKQHDGRPKKYNALIVAHRRGDDCQVPVIDSEHHRFIAKTLLPNYREFDELRHFTPNQNTDRIKPINIDGTKVGFALCEDGWDDDYEIKPMPLLASRGAEILINHSCSPFTVGKNGKRNRVFGSHAKNAGVPLIYVNAIGLQNNAKTIFSFDGSSVLYDRNGNVVYESPMFEEDMFIYNTNNGEVQHRFGVAPQKPQQTDIGDIYNALVFSIREYCAQSGIQNVVIGSSGGVDSAVSAALHVAALGSEHVYLVNMPSKYNSDTTKGLSHQLAINLGTPYVTVPIGESVELTTTQINGLTFRTPDELDACKLELSGFNLENVQARDRSSRILAAIASALPGGVFSNNGNKTETAVGYCVSDDMMMWSESRGYDCIKNNRIDDTVVSGNRIVAVLPSNKSIKHTITTCLGNALMCSPEHMIKTQNINTGDIQFKQADQLSIGDLICCSVGLNVYGNDNNIGSFVYTKSPHDYRSQYIEFPVTLTRDIAQLIGICIADGSYGDRDNVYTVTSTKSYVHEFVKSVIYSLGIPESSITDRKSTRYGILGTYINNCNFVAWLRWLGIGDSASSKCVPPIIAKADRENVCAFLSGIFMDSTCNGNRDELREITYHTASELLVDFVQSALMNIGVLCYKRAYDHGGNFPMWEVYIPSVESLRFIDSVNPIKQSINNKLHLNVANRKKLKGAFDYVYGNVSIRRQLDRFFERNGFYPRLSANRNKVNRNLAIKWLSHPLLMQLTKHADEHINVDEMQAFISDVNSSDRYYPIRDISIDHGSFPMLDISLDKTHEFAVNGVVVHNCTLYGDVSGYVAAIADLWKEDVYLLGKYINHINNKAIIPLGIFSIVASAELSGDQNVDEGKGDPIIYWYHDRLFKAWMQTWNRKTPEEILEWYAVGTLETMLDFPKNEFGERASIAYLFPTAQSFISDLERWWGLFKGMAVAKRTQAPPVIAVTPRAFGFDYRDALNCVYYTTRYRELKRKLLG